jgi:RNA polymerase sigma factor (sigma-70 family)
MKHDIYIYIWEEFRKEEESALSYIYHQNIDFLFFYGKRFTKDEHFVRDVIQELFCDLIKNRKNLGETDNIRLYLLKSFRRKLFREIEKKENPLEHNDNYQLHPEIMFSIEDDIIKDEERSQKIKHIRKGFRELNDEQREVLYYKFTCGYNSEE